MSIAGFFEPRSFAHMRDAFSRQFEEQSDGTYLYRALGRGAAYRVSEAQFGAFRDAFDRTLWRWYGLMMGGIFAAMAIASPLLFFGGAVGFGGVFVLGLAASFFLATQYGRRSRRAPEAVLAVRAPVARALTDDEDRRRRFGPLRWRAIGAIAIGLAGLIAFQKYVPGRHPMPDWLLGAEALAFTGAIAWAVWNKWRVSGPPPL